MEVAGSGVDDHETYERMLGKMSNMMTVMAMEMNVSKIRPLK